MNGQRNIVTTEDDAAHKFDHHPPANQRIQLAHERIRSAMKGVHKEISLLVPMSREYHLAMTKLEEVMFWANAGIAREGTNPDRSEDGTIMVAATA